MWLQFPLTHDSASYYHIRWSTEGGGRSVCDGDEEEGAGTGASRLDALSRPLWDSDIEIKT